MPGAIDWKIPTQDEANLNVSQGHPHVLGGRWARTLWVAANSCTASSQASVPTVQFWIRLWVQCCPM